MERKWLPTLSDLIDRLSIHQLKEVFIVENKDTYAREMKDIEHDIDSIISEKNLQLNAELIRTIIVLSQINAHIWYNESSVRQGLEQDLHKLKLTHGLNGIRNRAMNLIKILCSEADRVDFKIDCLAAEFKDWEISLFDKEDE